VTSEDNDNSVFFNSELVASSFSALDFSCASSCRLYVFYFSSRLFAEDVSSILLSLILAWFSMAIYSPRDLILIFKSSLYATLLFSCNCSWANSERCFDNYCSLSKARFLNFRHSCYFSFNASSSPVAAPLSSTSVPFCRMTTFLSYLSFCCLSKETSVDRPSILDCKSLLLEITEENSLFSN
jgi:hypothetical protein